MTKEELDLIEKVKQGDFSAFRRIMETYQDNIYYLAYDLTGNHPDAQDLCQEVFIKAFHAFKTFRADSKLSSWLYRITVNSFIDSKRKKKEHLFSDLEEETRYLDQVDSSQSNAPLTDPEANVEAELLQNHIHHALQKLSDRERSVFVLRHYHELQFNEISKILNLSVGTVKSLIFRAIRKLRKELAFYRRDFGLEEK